MLNLIERCFAEQARSAEWSAKLKEIFPAREKELETDAELYHRVSQASDARLGIATAKPAEASAATAS